jgi:hypothetical protein
VYKLASYFHLWKCPEHQDTIKKATDNIQQEIEKVLPGLKIPTWHPPKPPKTTPSQIHTTYKPTPHRQRETFDRATQIHLSRKYPPQNEFGKKMDQPGLSKLVKTQS